MKKAAALPGLLLFAVGLAQASPSYSVTINDPFANGDSCLSGCDVVANGDADRPLFDIQKAVLSVSGSTVSVSLYFDYGTNNTNLNPFTDTGITLNVGDLFFTVNGQDMFVAPLASHSGLTAGNLYSVGTNGLLTASQVLGNPQGVTYRPTSVVWGNSNDTQVAVGTETIVGGGDGVINPKFDVTLSFNDSSVAALAAAAANPSTFGIYFTSATCANDLIAGTGTPEPMSLGLVGLGLLSALVGCATQKWTLRRPARLPVVLKASVEVRAAQCNDRVGGLDGPEHT